MKPDAQNQFPSSVVLLAALILMAGHGCSGKSGVSPSGPRMEFEKTEIDLGRLEEGEVGNARFGFENMGKGLLKIDKVSTSCGCTSATSTVAAIGPGQKSFVDLALNTLGKQGAVTVSAKVKSNDQAHPEMELLLKGNVFTPLEW